MPNLPVALGYQLHGKEELAKYLEKYPGKWVAEPKYDGIRIVTIVRNHDDYSFITRNGKDVTKKLTKFMTGFDRVKSKGLRLWPRGFILDGELYARSWNKTQSFLFTQEVKEPPVFHYMVFDWLPYKDWRTRHSDIPYLKRRQELRKLLDPKIGVFVWVPQKRIKTVSDAYSYYHKCREQNLEGIMLKRLDTAYSFSRRHDWLKLKPKQTIDLKCVDLIEGTGKDKGKLGAIVVIYKGNRVKVGSGFTEKEREYFWKNPDKIKGKYVEIEYTESTGKSLRFPRFVRVRPDR